MLCFYWTATQTTNHTKNLEALDMTREHGAVRLPVPGNITHFSGPFLPNG